MANKKKQLQALAPDNTYTLKEREFYDRNAEEMAQGDHRQHDANPDYKEFFIIPYLLKNKPVGYEPANYKALDFACGTGRNVDNMLQTGAFGKVDGVDISEKIIEKAETLLTAKGYVKGEQFDLFVNNGIDLENLEKDAYDHVMSTIALQHIPVYDIRFGLLSGIYAVLKDGGSFVFQMGFGEGYGKSLYSDNCLTPEGFNSGHDVEVTDHRDVVADLKKIGFKDIECYIRDAFDDGHPKWLFVKCRK